MWCDHKQPFIKFLYHKQIFAFLTQYCRFWLILNLNKNSISSSLPSQTVNSRITTRKPQLQLLFEVWSKNHLPLQACIICFRFKFSFNSFFFPCFFNFDFGPVLLKFDFKSLPWFWSPHQDQFFNKRKL